MPLAFKLSATSRNDAFSVPGKNIKITNCFSLIYKFLNAQDLYLLKGFSGSFNKFEHSVLKILAS